MFPLTAAGLDLALGIAAALAMLAALGLGAALVAVGRRGA